MSKSSVEVPTGDALQRQIDDVEKRTQDERIRKTIAERVVMADEPDAVFVSHEDAFSESRARLLKRLAGKGDT